MDKYKEERDELAEQMNQLSELLLGYREGTFNQMVVSIANYKSKAFKHEMNANVEQLFELIDDLAGTKEDIISST